MLLSILCISNVNFIINIGGKKCLICHDRVSHDKYKLTPELAEARWAHQQARDRELEEVVDFLL